MRGAAQRMAAIAAAVTLVTAAAADNRAPAPDKVAKTPQTYEEMLQKLDARIASLEEETEALGPKIEVVHERMVARGRAYYRMVRAGLLPVGGGFDELVDHAAALERLRSALVRDVELEEKLRARLAAAQGELRKAKAQRTPLQIQTEAMRRARSAMQQQDERHAAFLRAFGGGSTPSFDPSAATVYGAQGASAGPAGAFPELVGRLPMPVSGRAEVVDPTDPSQRRGVLVVASRDTAVRAVHPGRVAFLGKTRFGETVVLDHGDRHYTVYGDLHHIEVKFGEVVSHRARLGWVLRFGKKAPSLYFEVRKGDEPLDARHWLGL